MALAALDAALEFQQHLVVPSSWKTEVKEESSSSEEDDEDEEEEQEEDASGEEEEVLTVFLPLLSTSNTLLTECMCAACRRRWSHSPRRGRTFCSSFTSLWKTEVSHTAGRSWRDLTSLHIQNV